MIILQKQTLVFVLLLTDIFLAVMLQHQIPIQNYTLSILLHIIILKVHLNNKRITSLCL